MNRRDFGITRNDTDDSILGGNNVDDYLSMEDIQQSRTSRMGNLHPILQFIPHVQTRRTIRTKLLMDISTTRICHTHNHQLFQNNKSILKTLDVWTWNPISQSYLHPNPRIRQFKISW